MSMSCRKMSTCLELRDSRIRCVCNKQILRKSMTTYINQDLSDLLLQSHEQRDHGNQHRYVSQMGRQNVTPCRFGNFQFRPQLFLKTSHFLNNDAVFQSRPLQRIRFPSWGYFFLLQMQRRNPQKVWESFCLIRHKTRSIPFSKGNRRLLMPWKSRR